ncbi:HD domain-containing phosphohydrolase [Desulfovibrio sp. ZJ200]|uniref:HD-GYP domain-containing protein n=1 Tax=Desulfovibrio sp. ZJ200 TaxID=2709792 RepID=UPI0013EBEC67|nr:HD domain-containing phosphohydrolase [Desulfovibrio sp. ZJ200]
MAVEARTAREIPHNINEEYYQINSEILASFPKYRPPVDLFCFREDIKVLAPYSKKGVRLSNEQVDEVARLCAEGNLFVSRSDHSVYSRHIVKQLDLVLQDNNLKESEIADICIRALALRYTDFNAQPVKSVFEPLYRDVMVVTEYIWEDKHRINALMRRLFRKHQPARHALNTMSVGLWLWLQIVSDFRRKDLDRMALALLLHDVGMSKVPAFVLNKQGPLKPEEWEKVLLHPMVGVKLMQKTDIAFEELLRASFEHHERMDGSGYPQKLKGSQISRVGRITAIADSFSAMICEKSYGQTREPLEAAKNLAADAQRYDPELTKLLMSAFATDGFGQFVDMDKNVDEPL